jgi:hypothetical protein
MVQCWVVLGIAHMLYIVTVLYLVRSAIARTRFIQLLSGLSRFGSCLIIGDPCEGGGCLVRLLLSSTRVMLAQKTELITTTRVPVILIKVSWVSWMLDQSLYQLYNLESLLPSHLPGCGVHLGAWCDIMQREVDQLCKSGGRAHSAGKRFGVEIEASSSCHLLVWPPRRAQVRHSVHQMPHRPLLPKETTKLQAVSFTLTCVSFFKY